MRGLGEELGGERGHAYAVSPLETLRAKPVLLGVVFSA
jgi:hypothetical protein